MARDPGIARRYAQALYMAAQKKDVVDRFERQYLRALVDAHAGNLAAAARQAGMDRKNLWLLLRKHGLVPARGKH